MLSRFIHAAARFHSTYPFSWLNNNPWYDVPHCVCLLIGGWTVELLLLLGYYESAAMNLHVRVFVWAYISIPLKSNPISEGQGTPARQSEGVALFGVSLDF